MVSRCFPGGYNVKLYISRGRLAWWLLAFFVLCYKLIVLTFYGGVLDGKRNKLLNYGGDLDHHADSLIGNPAVTHH